MKPRLADKQAVMAYCGGISSSTLHRWVNEGILPPPLPNIHRWDLQAIDRRISELSGEDPDENVLEAAIRKMI